MVSNDDAVTFLAKLNAVFLPNPWLPPVIITILVFIFNPLCWLNSAVETQAVSY